MSSTELDCELYSQNPRIVPFIARLRTVFCDVDLYRRLVGCRASDAQILLDSFQRLLDTPNLDPPFRKSLIVATQRISTRSGLYPACYELRDVDGGQHPVNGGGFADIYKGGFQGQAVCLKAIRLYQDKQIEYVLKQMSKEAILWGQLSHPNVLAIYGLFRFQHRLCIVSPWMENGDVRTYLKEKPATPRLPLAVDVAKGLLYLHENGIIHGDLKGGNILVDGAGRGRLADFGISAVSDSNIVAWTSQSSGASKGGSVRWQAPELFDIENGEAVKNSAASDVYAWGCVAFELFAGKVPFANIQRDTAIILHVKSGGRPIRPPPSSRPWRAWALTEEIWSLMEESWQSQPVQRPPSATIVERLETMLSSDIRLIPGSDMYTPEAFRREMNASLEIVTVEAFNLILDNATDIDYNGEFESTVFAPHTSKIEAFHPTFPSTSAISRLIKPLPAVPSEEGSPTRSMSSSAASDSGSERFHSRRASPSIIIMSQPTIPVLEPTPPPPLSSWGPVIIQASRSSSSSSESERSRRPYRSRRKQPSPTMPQPTVIPDISQPIISEPLQPPEGRASPIRIRPPSIATYESASSQSSSHRRRARYNSQSGSRRTSMSPASERFDDSPAVKDGRSRSRNQLRVPPTSTTYTREYSTQSSKSKSSRNPSLIISPITRSRRLGNDIYSPRRTLDSSWQSNSRRVFITFLAIQGLFKRGILGRVDKTYLPDPFAIITVEGDASQTHITSTAKATTTPAWEHVRFGLTVERTSVLSIQLYDRQTFKKDQGLLGDVKVNMNEVFEKGGLATIEAAMKRPKEAKLTVKLYADKLPQN